MELLPVDLLAAVFATLAPMSADEARNRAATAVETLRLTRDRADVAQLGLALRALELSPLSAIDRAGWVAFSRASQGQRERILVAWANSRIPQRRTAFQAFKRLGLFLAYADPGQAERAPSNALWASIGYRPRETGSAARVAELEPMQVDRTTRQPLRLKADVVVVGSGAGGGVVAARLAAAGSDVVVLEAGPLRAGGDVPSSEAVAWRDMYLDRGTTAPDDLSVTILAGATVGGGTTVNWTTSLPPPDWIVDEWEREHGLEDLRGGVARADVERLSDELRLMPPTVIPPKDRVIIDGAAALGWEAAPTIRNAGPCVDCGSCGFGCHLDAKRSTARVHLVAAQAAGARLLPEAAVARLVIEDRRARGVTGRLSGGRPFAVTAKQVVVAAGTLRTPLLLQSGSLGHPQIGRNLRLHPTPIVVAQMPNRIEMWTGPTQAARSAHFLAPSGGFLIESGPAHPGLAAAALPWVGRDAGQDQLARLPLLAPLAGIMRDAGSGTIRRRRSGRASIRYSLTSDDRTTARRALVAMARLAEAAGADEVLALTSGDDRWRRGEDFEAFLRRVSSVDVGPNRIVLFSAHQMGTARAGVDPRLSACDAVGRVRYDDRGGLVAGAYVADGSLLPSAVGVNPMLTIMLLAERTARAVLEDGR